MQNAQTSMLSVKELNEVLQRLQNNEEMPDLGTFSEVDTVFVAGLFLWYMQHKENWIKIPKFAINGKEWISLSGNNGGKRHFIHSDYFKQIQKLYGVSPDHIFEDFPNSKSEEGIYKADVWSSSFAPPIYITEEKIKYFFGTQESDAQIDDIKNTYISKLNNNKSNKNEEKYFAQENNITKDLEKTSPIHTFIFSVAYHKIMPFVKTKDKGFKSGEDGVQRLWQFTQEYVRGLHELAKNIVEHSGQGENYGQGMITIRAYSESETDKTKVLETHVFDYGDTGIIPKLKEYTTDRIKSEDKLSSDSQKKANNVYKEDLDTLNKGFTIDDFIEKTPLEQQKYRYISHYGINKLYRSIKKPLNGDVFIVSKGLTKERDTFSNNSTERPGMLYKGTHYFFRIPFIAENFGKMDIAPYPQPQYISTLGSSEALQKLMQRKITEGINLGNLEEEIKKIEDNRILDIKINKSINKENFDTLQDKLSCLSECTPSIITLNLEECEIGGESDLLRFLSYLTEEYKQSFVIYNLDFDVYQRMLDDNKAFAETRSTDSFWSDNKAMLVYTRVEDKNKKEFYFADILYGKSLADYDTVNKILGNTFPNSASIVDKGVAEASSNIEVELSDFFYDNVLLPYDILLKKKTGNPKIPDKALLLINIETILQNNLSRDELSAKETTYSERETLEDYINNIDGYHIRGTHFKIGNKVHSSDFYYGKRFFQNSFYTTRLAMYAAIKIKEEIKNTNQKITLVGYEIYSELLLSLIENNLKKIGWEKQGEEEKINHFIIQNKGSELTFLPQDTFENYIADYRNRTTIRIVPIAATGSTAQKMEKGIQLEIRKAEKKIAKNAKKTDDETEAIIVENAIKEYKSTKPYNIVLVQSPDKKKFGDIIKIAENDNNILKINVAWYNLKDCPLCYGCKYSDCKEYKWYEFGKFCPSRTKPLFDTDSSSLTPSLIFGNPKGKTKSKDGNEVESSMDFDNLNFKNSLKYQSILRNGNYRVYAVDSDKFIEENKEGIEKWLKEIVRPNLENNFDSETMNKIVGYHKDVFEKIDKDKRMDFCKEYNINITDCSLEEKWFGIFVDLYKKEEDRENEKDVYEEVYDKWKRKVEESFKLKKTDTVVIVAPCHESNSKFIHLVNEHVFSSTASIIHYQNDVDYEENFSVFNKNSLTRENTKIFYVDDSLITSAHFFELFDLVRKVKGEKPLTASILLKDKAVPFVHDRAVRRSKNYFAFATYNQPPTLTISANRPLEYERKRYESLQSSSLHDTLQVHFYNSVCKLIPKKPTNKKPTDEKKIRRLKMFEATHKIYKYFTENEEIPDLTKEEERKKFVDFKLKFKETIQNELLQAMNKEALLKVLAQYPFVLYKDLRDKTFEWQKDWMKTDITNSIDDSAFNIESNYNAFSSFKFQLRRATFLGNYRVLEQDFLGKLLTWFKKIDAAMQNLTREYKEKENEIKNLWDEVLKLNTAISVLQKGSPKNGQLFEIQEKQETLKQKKETIKERDDYLNKIDNLRDFPIFVLGSYIELIQKNGWVPYHILQAVENVDFKKSKQGSQFLRMLKIESATIIDDFVEMIQKEHYIGWRDMYKEEKKPELYIGTGKIERFILRQRAVLLKTNKFLAIKDTFLRKTNGSRKKRTIPLINYLWIKQLLFADLDTNSHLPKEIKYQEKIDEIINKMKGFFLDKDNVKAFFIVTDGQEKPHIMKDELSLFGDFRREFDIDKEIKDLDVMTKNFEQKNVNNIISNGEANNLETQAIKRKEFNNQRESAQMKTVIEFLNGKPCNTNKAAETTAEFVLNNNGKWENIYEGKEEEGLVFMPKDNTYRWLYLIRISKFKDDEFKKQGLFGFACSESLEDEFIPKQLLMLLRKDMSKFIDKHHKNDEFSEQIQDKERIKFYEEKFDKFNHNAMRYISDKTEKVREKDNKLALFTINQLVFGQVLIGNYLANYLKKINNEILQIANPKQNSSALSNTEKQWLDDFIKGLKTIYSGTFDGLFVQFTFSINDYSSFATQLMFEDLKVILIELISNSLRYDQGQNRQISIDFEMDKIVFKSKTIKTLTQAEVMEINKFIREKYPRNGIGLFMINKIIKSSLNQDIEIRFVDSEFQVIIPNNNK